MAHLITVKFIIGQYGMNMPSITLSISPVAKILFSAPVFISTIAALAVGAYLVNQAFYSNKQHNSYFDSLVQWWENFSFTDNPWSECVALAYNSGDLPKMAGIFACYFLIGCSAMLTAPFLQSANAALIALHVMSAANLNLYQLQASVLIFMQVVLSAARAAVKSIAKAFSLEQTHNATSVAAKIAYLKIRSLDNSTTKKFTIEEPNPKNPKSGKWKAVEYQMTEQEAMTHLLTKTQGDPLGQNLSATQKFIQNTIYVMSSFLESTMVVFTPLLRLCSTGWQVLGLSSFFFSANIAAYLISTKTLLPAAKQDNNASNDNKSKVRETISQYFGSKATMANRAEQAVNPESVINHSNTGKALSENLKKRKRNVYVQGVFETVSGFITDASQTSHIIMLLLVFKKLPIQIAGLTLSSIQTIRDMLVDLCKKAIPVLDKASNISDMKVNQDNAHQWHDIVLGQAKHNNSKSESLNGLFEKLHGQKFNFQRLALLESENQGKKFYLSDALYVLRWACLVALTVTLSHQQLIHLGVSSGAPLLLPAIVPSFLLKCPLIIIHALTLIFVERLSYYLTISLQATTDKANNKTKPGHNSEQAMALFSLSFAAIVQFFLLPQSLMTAVIGSSIYSAGFIYPMLACMLSVIGNRFLKPGEAQLKSLENDLKATIVNKNDIDAIKAMSLRSSAPGIENARKETPVESKGKTKTSETSKQPHTKQSIFAPLSNLTNFLGLA